MSVYWTPEEQSWKYHLPALLSILDTSKLETTGLAERLACLRGHAVGISVISRVQCTVVIGGLTVTTNRRPVGIGNWLDSGGAIR
jgi:hypothetical protein